jgi:hypothetical protein
LLIEALRRLVLLAVFVLRVVYQVFLSWWVNPLLDRWARNDFARDLQTAIPSLFDLHGGRVVGDPKPAPNEHAMGYVCIATGGLIFKFRQRREESFGVQVSPVFAPGDFCELLDALKVVDPTVDTKIPALDFSWRCWGQLLEPHFYLLEQAFSRQQFAETKEKLYKRISAS